MNVLSMIYSHWCFFFGEGEVYLKAGYVLLRLLDRLLLFVYKNMAASHGSRAKNHGSRERLDYLVAPLFKVGKI